MSSVSTPWRGASALSSATISPSRWRASPIWMRPCWSWPATRWPSMPDSREPRVRGRGHPLPFSKGRMATTLFLSGVEAEHAYALALEIELAVLELGADEITLDDLHGVVEDV